MSTLSLWAAVLILAPQALATPPCVTAETAVMVDTTKHQLTLCENGRVAASYGVRLGRGGVGKTKEGDGKTPLGRYPLGHPRGSKRYGIFIPIGYPTPEQRRNGYTGGEVGIHGPHRFVRWLGSLVNTFDSSDGCVGIATDTDMTTIADWVSRRHVRTIVLQ